MTPFPNGVPLTLKAIAALGLTALAGVLIYFLFVRPEASLRKAATAETEAIIADTRASAAEDTIRIVVDHQNEVATITHRTEVTNAEILSAPGADQPVDPVGYDAFVRALCLQDGRRDPQCASMLHRDGISDGPEG